MIDDTQCDSLIGFVLGHSLRTFLVREDRVADYKITCNSIDEAEKINVPVGKKEYKIICKRCGKEF